MARKEWALAPEVPQGLKPGVVWILLMQGRRPCSTQKQGAFCRVEGSAPPTKCRQGSPGPLKPWLCPVSYCTTKLVLAPMDAAFPVLLVVACTRYVPRGAFLFSL